MEINTWINGCKVRGFDWIDGKRYYLNVQYFFPGSSIEKPPVWDKTIYITKDEKGMEVVRNYLSSLVNFICGLDMEPGREVTLTFE